MNEKLFKLMLAILSDEQKYSIALQAGIADTEAKELLGFDCHQYGLPLPKAVVDESPKV